MNTQGRVLEKVGNASLQQSYTKVYQNQGRYGNSIRHHLQQGTVGSSAVLTHLHDRQDFQPEVF
jgi:hypothetical protein